MYVHGLNCRRCGSRGGIGSGGLLHGELIQSVNVGVTTTTNLGFHL